MSSCREDVPRCLVEEMAPLGHRFQDVLLKGWPLLDIVLCFRRAKKWPTSLIESYLTNMTRGTHLLERMTRGIQVFFMGVVGLLKEDDHPNI